MARTKFAILAAVAALAGCDHEKAKPPEPPPPEVVVGQPVRMNVTDYREYTGYIQAIKVITIRARVRGELKSIKFQEGTDVQAGKLLYEIEPAEFVNAVDQSKAALDKAKADIARADAEWDKAEAELVRAKKLKESNSISEDEYTTTLASEKVARAAKTQATASREQAEAALASAKLDLSYTKIYAPVTGRIGKTLVNVGNLVGYNEATPLTNLITTNPVYVEFDVPEADALEYDRLARAEHLPEPSDRKIPVFVGVTGEKGFPHQGVIDFRENRIETGSGTVRMRGELSNDKRTLSTGMYARVRVPKGDGKSRLMVPEASVQSDQRGRYVLVVGADDVVEYRPVTLGPRVGTFIAAETGLKEGDWIVVSGVQLARPKSKVTPQKKPLPKPVPEDEAPIK
ncbi:MAG TPA: efflux RND transporter periplasmic adaptor subunit [Fimbriiglobus sp.]